MLPFHGAIETLLKEIKSRTGFHVEALSVFILGMVVLFFSLALLPGRVLGAIDLALFLSPLWLPPLVFTVAWGQYLILIRSEFIHSQAYMVLEIKPPRNLVKTPLAMEAVIAGLHFAPGEGNWYKKYVQGGLRPYWSLEIASIGGEVHFFIWTRAAFRRAIEAQIYAQYPGAQVIEAPDYTRMISADPREWEIFGCDYKHSRPDAVPIRTYVDYGLDKTQKEPEQVDPLANLVEYLGSMNSNEQFWVQFIIRVHKGDKFNKKNADGKAYTWKDDAKDHIKRLRELARFKTKVVDPVTGQERETEGFPLQSKGQMELISNIERNVSKLGFDVGIRAVYLARKGHFNGSAVAGLSALFKQFSADEYYNDIAWNTSRGLLKFEDYPWEINVAARKDKMRREWVDAFRRRQFFFSPHDNTDYMVMSTEEIATLFHIPSGAVGTPTLPRIESATSEAPSNLPT